MSKTKGKSVARKMTTKPARRTAAAKPQAGDHAPATRTSQVTIFIFRTGNGTRIRTAPQRAYAGPGHIEWTVVNMVDGSNVPVTITWPNGGPWGKEPICIKENGRHRMPVKGVKKGVYKYVVSALDAQEDPEVEIPEM